MALIAEAALRATLTPSGYAAEAAVAAARGMDAPSLAPWREALRELMLAHTQARRIGINLNQALRALHADGDPPDSFERTFTNAARAVSDIDTATHRIIELARR